VAKALSAILLVTTTVAAQADPSQYLCIAEQSAGFHYDKQTKAWGPQVFVTHQKYILRRLNDDDRKRLPAFFEKHPNMEWGFFQFGRTDPIALSTSESDLCCGPWDKASGDVRFDKDSLRFERAIYGAYIMQGAWIMHDEGKMAIENPDDLFIEIGKCSPF
jgi:hypothetical protein